MNTNQKNMIKYFGEYLTSANIFENYILPEIKAEIYNYIWVDLFCGGGDLILPILKIIKPEERVSFFLNHIYLFDIQEKFIEEAIKKASEYGIPIEVAKKNIIKLNSIKNYPEFLLNLKLSIYHITNPPYLYKGYISKNKELRNYLEYFSGINSKYQDIYQIALINDLRHGIKKMIYILPSNFLFGATVSNKIRDDLFKFYNLNKAFIFEEKIFQNTGTNVVICFFEKKDFCKVENIKFTGIKINKDIYEKIYILEPKYHFRANASEFEDYVLKNRAKNPIKVKFYLTLDEIKKNYGKNKIILIDVNSFKNKKYKRCEFFVNNYLYNKIKSNILFVKTIDSGKEEGKVGLYLIKDVFNADGIVISKKTHRTHPIQIFFEPQLSYEDQIKLKNYFNTTLNMLRDITDSDFLTTYKYSNSKYVRKYLGLSQVRKLIETFKF